MYRSTSKFRKKKEGNILNAEIFWTHMFWNEIC